MKIHKVVLSDGNEYDFVLNNRAIYGIEETFDCQLFELIQDEMAIMKVKVLSIFIHYCCGVQRSKAIDLVDIKNMKSIVEIIMEAIKEAYPTEDNEDGKESEGNGPGPRLNE